MMVKFVENARWSQNISTYWGKPGGRNPKRVLILATVNDRYSCSAAGSLWYYFLLISMVSEHSRDYINRYFLKKLFSLLGYIRNFIYELLYFAVIGWGILRRGAWIQAWLQQDPPVLREKKAAVLVILLVTFLCPDLLQGLPWCRKDHYPW